MSYRKNDDGSYTAYRVMYFDGTTLEATAQELDNANRMLKEEVNAYKTYSCKEIGTFNSPSCLDGKGIIYSRDDGEI
jgi:hypothetical protein